MVSDRWSGFEHLDSDRRQVCWSHIERDFRRHSEGLAEQQLFGEQVLELTRRLFSTWHAYQHERHDREQLIAGTAPIQTELRQLEEASPKSRCTRWPEGAVAPALPLKASSARQRPMLLTAAFAIWT